MAGCPAPREERTFLLSQGISIIGCVLFWFLFVPGKPHLFLWALPFHSFGIGGLFTLMMSMTADVCTSTRRTPAGGEKTPWVPSTGG